MKLTYEKQKEMIPTPSIGKILFKEFMEPLNLTAYKLAQDIHVPNSRVQDILNGKRKIDADVSLRLSRYFNVSDRYFLCIQNDIEIRKIKQDLKGELLSIRAYSPE